MTSSAASSTSTDGPPESLELAPSKPTGFLLGAPANAITPGGRARAPDSKPHRRPASPNRLLLVGITPNPGLSSIEIDAPERAIEFVHPHRPSPCRSNGTSTRCSPGEYLSWCSTNREPISAVDHRHCRDSTGFVIIRRIENVRITRFLVVRMWYIPPSDASRGADFDPSHRRDLDFLWSGRRDSNPRPQPWQGCALPTEPRPRKALTLAVAPG